MKDKTAIIESLERSPIILSQFIQSVPDRFLKQRRGEGFWTIKEHAIHLAQVQPMLLERLNRFVEEDRPEFVPFIPEDESSKPKPDEQIEIEMDLKTALQDFESFRKMQLSLISSVSPAVWKKEAIHPEYIQYSFYILVRHILMHDHWHMYRMEELWLAKDDYLTVLQG